MKLKKIETIKRIVEVYVPLDNASNYETQRMGVIYPVLKQKRIDELVDADDEDAMVKEIFIGQYSNQHEDGTPIEDTEENRAMMVDIPYIKAGIVRGFFDLYTGGKRKN